jgi:hypothetical protein
MKKILLLFSLITFMVISNYPQDTIHVPADYSTIQAGINAANNGDLVLVEDGTYIENINYRGKAITVASNFIIDGDTNHISNTIIDGSQPSNPDSASVVTFDSGEDTTSILYGFTITGGTGTLSHLTQSTRRGGGVLCYQSGARIEYNIIENNECVHQLYAFGGGICEMNVSGDPHFSYVIVENNKIRNNHCESSEANAIGGGIYFRGEGRIDSNHIINNEVEFNGVAGNDRASFGGGISCGWWEAGYAYVKIHNNLIANNRALSNNPLRGGNSGGVYIEFTICDFRGNTVKDNRVSGAPAAFGAGMRVLFSALPASVTDNSFINNGPLDSSVMVYGGGLLTVQTENLTIENNEFLLNNGQYGGGIYLSEDTVVSVRNNKFLQNDAINSGGGALITDGSSPLFENNLVAGNTAWSGGGVAVLSASKKNYNDSRINSLIVMSGGLGEITAEKNVTTTLPSQLKKTTSLISKPLLINNTIVDNSANTLGGGIFNENSHFIILNTILWDNTAAQDSQIYVFNGDVFVEHSDVQGGWSGEGNIDEEPLFIIGDTLFHLSDSSPCVNTGADSLYYSGQWYFCPPDDYEGDERPYMGIGADIGADETQVPVGIKSETSGIPQSYKLHQNYPNPFNPSTTIEFALPKPGFVTLSIFNILGENVAIPVSEYLAAGIYKYHWNAKGLTSGVYLYKLEAANNILVRKMVLLR